MKTNCLSTKAGMAAAVLNVIALIAFCIYGAVYDYFDTVVFLTLALGAVCSFLYAKKEGLQLLNLAGVICVSFGLGLFFLNSYPVWADRLNDITMYGSRGTLVPVVTIMILCFATVVAGIVSCFAGKE